MHSERGKAGHRPAGLVRNRPRFIPGVPEKLANDPRRDGIADAGGVGQR